jgi:hypothetical protein
VLGDPVRARISVDAVMTAMITHQERIATLKAALRQYEWIQPSNVGAEAFCLSCGHDRPLGHAADCAWREAMQA